MAINKGTLAKKVNGVLEYIYPKTSADMVMIGNTNLNTLLSNAVYTDTTYSADDVTTVLDGTTFKLKSGIVTAGSKGPIADVTGSEGNTIKVPKVTVDTYGRVTGLTEYTYTSKDTTYTAGTDFAAVSHTHGSDDITALDASKITTGTIDIARLPAGALERLVTVIDDTARFALTSSDVQLGDTVKVRETGSMYIVTDASKLNSADGYTQYTAGAATSVAWSGITNKPETYTPSSHTHTSSEVTDLATTVAGLDAGTVNGKTVASNVPADAVFTDTTYSADDTTTVLDGTTFKLKSGVITAGSKGPTADVTGSNDTTVKIPKITVDTYGRVTALSEYTYTSKDTTYTHPSYTAQSSGLYKVTVDGTGHVSAVAAVEKSDITSLGIPGSDTTYESKTAVSEGTDVSLVTTGEKYVWNNKTDNTGTVTSVAAGVGLAGGTVTETGTIKANLKSETASSLASNNITNTEGRQYAVQVDSNGNLSVNVPWTDNNTTYTPGSDFAAVSHTHGNDDITALDASKITTGTIDIARLPAGALERLVNVADETARFALTTSSVQLGDTVKQLDTGVMYVVTDTDNLDSADGYTEYTAGAATSVPWSGITNKPESYTPSSHTHTASQITDLSTTVAGLDAGTVNGKTVASNVPADAVFTDTTYSADDVTTVLDGTTFKLKSGIVTSGSKGPTADVTGSNGNTIKIPKITVDTYGRVTGLSEYTYTSVDNNTTYSADNTTTALDGTTFKLKSGIVTAGSKGPTANVTGSNGATVKIPKVTVDTYGRVTGLTEYTYTSVDTSYSATRTRYTLLASGWVDNGNYTYTYSLESSYPHASKLVTVYFSNPTMTFAQYNAFVNAIVIGSDVANTLTAYGVKPSIDIPVLLEVVSI